MAQPQLWLFRSYALNPWMSAPAVWFLFVSASKLRNTLVIRFNNAHQINFFIGILMLCGFCPLTSTWTAHTISEWYRWNLMDRNTFAEPLDELPLQESMVVEAFLLYLVGAVFLLKPLLLKRIADDSEWTKYCSKCFSISYIHFGLSLIITIVHHCFTFAIYKSLNNQLLWW